MTGTEDRIRERLAEIQGRLDEIAKASADRDMTQDEVREHNKLVGEEANLQQQLREVDQGREARTTDWLNRRGLPGPGAFADGHPASYDDGDRLSGVGGRIRRPTRLTGYTKDGRAIPILAPDEQLSNPAEAEEARAKLGAWVYAQATGDWDRFRVLADAAGSVTTGGGLLVDRSISPRVIDLARAKARVVEAGANSIPMETREVVIAKVGSDPSFEWRSENKDIPVSSMTFTGITLRSRTLGAISTAPIELVADAVNLGALIEEALGAALGQELDRVALIGKGSEEEPLGLENVPGVNTRGSIGTPANYDDFSLAVEDIWTDHGEPGAVIFAPRTAGTLDRLKDTTNQPLQAPETFKNLAKLPTGQVPVDRGAGSDESLAFVGDFSQLWLGIRQDITVEASRHAGFGKGQVHLRAILRADVAVVRPDFFTVMSGITAS